MARVAVTHLEIQAIDTWYMKEQARHMNIGIIVIEYELDVTHVVAMTSEQEICCCLSEHLILYHNLSPACASEKLANFL